MLCDKTQNAEGKQLHSQGVLSDGCKLRHLLSELHFSTIHQASLVLTAVVSKC
jgi:hypothetical protein